jgi:hypothetical protein
MRKFRSLAAQSPALAISLVALIFAMGSGAGYAANAAGQAGQAGKISFHVLRLVHGWHPGAPTIRTGEPAYGTNGDGIVYVSGWLSRSTPPKGANGTFAILPKGLRPTHQLDVTVTTVANTTATVQITPDGQMFVFGTDAPQFTSLDGVSFAING